MVSKINHDARSVTVEWYEKNETKGKEVELDAILQLNADIMYQDQEAASKPKIIKQTSSNPLSRVSFIIAYRFDYSIFIAQLWIYILIQYTIPSIKDTIISI